ncbi:hypothetical protein JCM10135_06710 [Stetteria hydrogenophila]
MTILTAAVLVAAIALYAYFTSYYSREHARRGLVEYLDLVAASVDAYIDYYSSNTSGGYHVYCYMVSIKNSDPATAITLYVSVLPAARSTGGSVVVSAGITSIPVDTGVSPPERVVYVYNLTDYDRDGFVDLVGDDNAGNPLVLLSLNRPLYCSELYGNQTITGNDLNPVYADPSRVYLDPDNSLEAYAGELAGALDGVPLWRVTLAPNGKESLFIMVASTGEPEYLSLALFAVVNNNYYLTNLVTLPTTS